MAGDGMCVGCETFGASKVHPRCWALQQEQDEEFQAALAEMVRLDEDTEEAPTDGR